ncbi:MAG: hypothetical protein AUI89_06235 [Gemmatimonadetes bacterium 13_1_40CM_3_65_8]|nr:MAG: hypothetical protein AUI89_06235 [Gemmatimonadetes bacterium 13_1_40CM_3_65_8]
MAIALALSGGGAKGDFEVGAVRCLNDFNIVPSIVSSTSVGSVNALKVAEGPQGLPGLEAVWLSLMGSGDMFAREAWTMDPDLEDTVLKVATQLVVSSVSFPLLSDVEALNLLERTITNSIPVIGVIDIGGYEGTAAAATTGLLPIVGFLVAAQIHNLEKLVKSLGEARAIFNLDPTRDLARANISPQAIAAWGAQGNRLRLAMVGLGTGKLRYLTETGSIVERDGLTPAHDRETGFEIRSTYLTGMLASSSIPAIFPPVVIADDAYVDGGIREVMPLEVTVLLGGQQIFAIHCSTREVDFRPQMKDAKLLDILLRSLMDITINEVAFSDTFRTGSWGPRVVVTVIQPRVEIHNTFTIYPALVRNRMAYGYLCAADVVKPATGNEGRCQEIADQIAVLRYGIARLEAWYEGRPIPPSLTVIGRPPLGLIGDVRDGIYRLKLRVRALAREREQLGGAMPPQDGSWTDPRRWWQGWERHPLYQSSAPQHGEVFAISNAPNHLDVFIAASDQRILQATWTPESREGWEGWYQVADGGSQPGSPIFGASRHDGSTDLMIVGTDGAIYSAQWDRQFQSDDGWHGWHKWSPVLSGRASQHAAVTAASRRPEFLDAFVAGTDGRIYTAGFDPQRKWTGWRPVSSLLTKPGAPVHAVSRKRDNLDILVTDLVGVIQWSHWDPSLPDWTAWTSVIGGGASPGAPVTAVSRAADFIDVFVVGKDGHIYTAAMDPVNGWRGWWPIAGPTAPQGSTVSAISRAADQLDIFVTDDGGNIQWSHWDPTRPGWAPWLPVLNGRAAPGTTIAATSRAPGLMDLFMVGLDGKVWSAAFGANMQWAGWWRLHADLKPNPIDTTQIVGDAPF